MLHILDIMFICMILHVTVGVSMVEAFIVPRISEILLNMDDTGNKLEYREITPDDKDNLYFLPKKYNIVLKSPDTNSDDVNSNTFLKKKPLIKNLIPNEADYCTYCTKKQDDTYNENIVNKLTFKSDVSDKIKLGNDKPTSIQDNEFDIEIQTLDRLQELENSEFIRKSNGNNEENIAEKEEFDYKKYNNKGIDGKKFILNNIWNYREDVADTRLLRFKRRDNVIEEENVATTVSTMKYTWRDTKLTNNLIFKNINC